MKKEINEFPGYWIYKDGTIIGLKGKEMKPIVDSGGRIRIAIVCTHNNKKYMKSISRLVAENFIPNPENKPQVDHIDGDRSNNHVSNLRWVTNIENQMHRDEQGNTGAGYANSGKQVMYDSRKYSTNESTPR